MSHCDDDALPYEKPFNGTFLDQRGCKGPECGHEQGGTTSPAERIRALNDALRVHGQGGRVMLSRAIACLEERTIRAIISAVRRFDDFDESNDPHGEHDCAILTVEGISVMFKIDYYDLDLAYHSPDPADPHVTRRVLTVMLADDY